MVDLDGRQRFSDFLKEFHTNKLEDHQLPAVIGKFECGLPESGLVFDYFFQQNGRGKWQLWTDLLKGRDLVPDKSVNVQNIIVPTMDTARSAYLLDLCVSNSRPILFVGPTGTGKKNHSYLFAAAFLSLLKSLKRIVSLADLGRVRNAGFPNFFGYTSKLIIALTLIDAKCSI